MLQEYLSSFLSSFTLSPNLLVSLPGFKPLTTAIVYSMTLGLSEPVNFLPFQSHLELPPYVPGARPSCPAYPSLFRAGTFPLLHLDSCCFLWVHPSLCHSRGATLSILQDPAQMPFLLCHFFFPNNLLLSSRKEKQLIFL